jgi:hypothetical protein
VVLVDLNASHPCAPALCRDWVPHPSAFMRLRVAVREVEAWLLADAPRLAAFLGVAERRIPLAPEADQDPKQTLVRLAGQSRRRDIRADMVPRHGSGRSVGPAYVSRIIEFVTTVDDIWSPHDAAQRSESLRRCLAALETLP